MCIARLTHVNCIYNVYTLYADDSCICNVQLIKRKHSSCFKVVTDS